MSELELKIKNAIDQGYNHVYIKYTTKLYNHSNGVEADLELKQEISGLKTLITGLIHNKPEDNTDQWMNIEQLRAYHPDRPARSTIYDWVCQNRIPVHKDGKKLRFLKSEIDQWLSGGKIKTREELEVQAYNHIKYKTR